MGDMIFYSFMPVWQGCLIDADLKYTNDKEIENGLIYR